MPRDRFAARRHTLAAGCIAEAAASLQEALSILPDGHQASKQVRAALLVLNAAQTTLSQEGHPSSW